MSNFQIFDLERVEVLKGPQGTLFGRNSTAGAVNFYSHNPSDEFEGYVSASYARWNASRLEAAVGGPLSDNINYRVSVHGGRDRSDMFQYQAQPVENPGSDVGRFAFEEPCLSHYNPTDIGCLTSTTDTDFQWIAGLYASKLDANMKGFIDFDLMY